MNAIEIKQKIEQGEKINIFDIRAKERYDIFHLPGAINIERGMLLEKPEQYMERRGQYFITCNGGNSASMVAKMLQALGFDIKSIEGGMNPIMPK